MCACKPGFELHSDKRSCVGEYFRWFALMQYSMIFFVIADACGGTFKAPNGTVTSPSFPELYPRNKKCAWQIEVPPQHVIFFNFTHLDLEGNNYDQQVRRTFYGIVYRKINNFFQLCEYDQVNVSSLQSNGKFKQLGSFCGTKKPKILSSESNVLQVTFASDDSVQQTGFAAVYFMGV